MRPPRGDRGAILVELVISALLMAIAVSAICAAMLAGTYQKARAGFREEAALYMNQLLENLKDYVTADSRTYAPGAPGGAGTPWRLPGDTCSCWALEEGTHDASSLLTADFRQRYAAKMSYTVQVVYTKNLEPLRRVEVQMDWDPAKG